MLRTTQHSFKTDHGVINIITTASCLCDVAREAQMYCLDNNFELVSSHTDLHAIITRKECS